MWQLWVLLSGAMTGLAQGIGKGQIHKISALQMGLIRDMAGLGVVTYLWIQTGGAWWGWQSVAGVLNGAMVAIGVALYFIATRESFSGSSVFGYLISQVFIVTAAAIIFGEWIYFDIRTVQGIGNISVLILTILAMIVYSSSLKLSRKWLGVLVLSAAINVVGNLVAKHYVAGRLPVFDYFFAEQLGLVISGVIVLNLRSQNLAVGLRSWVIGIIQGLVAITGPMIYLQILAEHPLSLASLIRRIASILVTVGMGLFWYRESKVTSWRSGIALVVGMIAFGVALWVNK